MEYIKDFLADLNVGSAAVSAVITLLFSYLTARFTAQNEIRKYELATQREDKLAERKAFQQMVAAVTTYIYEPVFDRREEALTAIAVARTFKGGYLGELIDDLRISVASDDRQKSERILSDIYANHVEISEI